MYEIVLTLHIISMFWNIFWVIVSDLSGLAWVLGYKERVSGRFLRMTHTLIWIGLGISILTGSYLFSSTAEYLLTVPAFYTKMLFVVALVINAGVIGRHITVAEAQPFADVSSKEKRVLFISAAVSTGSWIGVLVSAKLLGL